MPQRRRLIETPRIFKLRKFTNKFGRRATPRRLPSSRSSSLPSFFSAPLNELARTRTNRTAALLRSALNGEAGIVLLSLDFTIETEELLYADCASDASEF